MLNHMGALPVGRAWIREDPCSSDPLCMLGSLTVVFGFWFFFSFSFFLFPLAHPADFLLRLGFFHRFYPALYRYCMHFQGFGGVRRTFRWEADKSCLLCITNVPREKEKEKSWTKFKKKPWPEILKLFPWNISFQIL